MLWKSLVTSSVLFTALSYIFKYMINHFKLKKKQTKFSKLVSS